MAEFVEIMKIKSRMCSTNECMKCELRACRYCTTTCKELTAGDFEQAEEIMMKWAKEHPVQTNAEKFKEVFGKEIYDKNACLIKCQLPQGVGCEGCIYHHFWYKEYKAPTEVSE